MKKIEAEKYTLYCGDCLTILPELAALGVDAVVADPPYGMGWQVDSTRFVRANRYNNGNDAWRPVIGDDAPFDPTPWLDYPQVILWGANHYAARLPVGTSLVWIKKPMSAFGSFLSDAEIAWQKGGHGVYCFRYFFFPLARGRDAGRPGARPVHPTQKPVALMGWCVERVSAPGGLVLDPYMGSDTTGVAAIRAGRRFVGVELDPEYFDIAHERIANAAGDYRLMGNERASGQTAFNFMGE